MTTQLNLHTQQESKKLFDMLGQSSPGMSLAHHEKLVSLVFGTSGIKHPTGHLTFGSRKTGVSFAGLKPYLDELKAEQNTLWDLLGQSSPGMSLSHQVNLRSIFPKNVRLGSTLRVLAACLVAQEKGETFFHVGDKRVNMTPSDLEVFMGELCNPRAQMDVYKHLQPTERGEELLAAWKNSATTLAK